MPKSKTPASVFPSKEVRNRLRSELSQLEADTAAIRDEWEPTFDSLAVVNVICCIDEVVPGVELAPEKIVRKGGYSTIDEAVEHIVAGVERAWRKQKN